MSALQSRNRLEAALAEGTPHADALRRYVADQLDGESVEDAFARRVSAAYELYLIETGHEPVSANVIDALVAYGRVQGARPAGFALTRPLGRAA